MKKRLDLFALTVTKETDDAASNSITTTTSMDGIAYTPVTTVLTTDARLEIPLKDDAELNLVGKAGKITITQTTTKPLEITGMTVQYLAHRTQAIKA